MITVLALLHLILVTPSEGDGRITGRVLDHSGAGVQGATVLVRPHLIGAVTDLSGAFSISAVPAGILSVTVSHVGYRRVTLASFILPERTDTSLTIVLDEQPIQSSQVVVTASRKEQSLQDVPVSVSTIDAQDIASQATVTVDEALRHVSGVSMIDDQINIRGSTGYSRGVGSRVLLLLDGIPFLTGDTGEINWETIPLHEIERVEVVKGPGSALYGSSALGGVVNIITRKPTGMSQTGIRGSVGIYDQPKFTEWRWSPRARRFSGLTASAQSAMAGVATTVSLSRLMDEGYRQNDVAHRYGLYLRSEVPLGGQDALTLTVNAVHRRNGNFFWWKSLREATLPPDEYQDRWVTSTRGNVAATFTSIWTSGLLSVLRMQYFGNAWFDEVRGIQNSRSSSDQVFAEWQITAMLGSNHTMVAGISGNLDRVKANLFGTHPGGGIALFVQDEMEVSENLSASAGVRLDREKVSALPSASQVDPKLGMTWRMSAGTTLRASLGTGFRYPSIGELYSSVTTGFGSINVVPNPALRPERSIAGELGINHVIGEHAWIDVAAFQSSYRDLIEAGVHPTLLVIRFDNVKRARIRGIESSGGVELFDRSLRGSAGVTLMDPRDAATGAFLKFRPRMLAVGRVAYAWTSLVLSIDYRYVSRLDAIDEDLVTIAQIQQGSERVPIHIADFRASWDFASLGLPVRAEFAVRNLFHYRYVELAANLGQPRTYQLTIESLW